MLHMIVEQTPQYSMRMEYDSATNTFREGECRSLAVERGFGKPYGWIMESGTPPEPHWDCILMSDGQFELGDKVPVNVIGVFKRNDNDHKYVVAELSRSISDLSQLTRMEVEELHRLYPRVHEGEGWFGREEAVACMESGEKAF